MSYTLLKDLGKRWYTNSKGEKSFEHVGQFECDNCKYIRIMPIKLASCYKHCTTCKHCSKVLMEPGEKERKERLRTVWRAMKSRCYNENNDHYKYYGAKGITICKAWLDDFEQFWKDNKDQYKRGLSIDRINPDKGYYPGNVQWIPYGLNSVKDKFKPVLQYEFEYTKVHEIMVHKEPLHRYSSLTAAFQATGIPVTHIVEVCLGHRSTAGGYIWKYDDGKEMKQKVFLTKTARPINQYKLDKSTGDLVFIKQWETAYQAEAALKDEGVNHTNIAKVCNGKRKSCGGYYWEYAEV